MSKEQSKKFLSEVQNLIQGDRKNNYDQKDFEQLFYDFDEDNNQKLSKNEMSQLIKIAFKNKNSPRKQGETPKNKKNNKVDTPQNQASQDEF